MLRSLSLLTMIALLTAPTVAGRFVDERPLHPRTEILPWVLSSSEEVPASITAEACRLSERSQPELVALADPAPAAPPVVPSAGLIWPIGSTSITSTFGAREDPVERLRRRQHQGIDIRAAKGTPVLAVAEGVVVSIKRLGFGGLTIKLEHRDGLRTRYAHLSRVKVKVGDSVQAGQRIALSGQSGRVTGPHLHFEVWQVDAAQDPLQYDYQLVSPAQPRDDLFAGALRRGLGNAL